jgi:hypothetical protein
MGRWRGTSANGDLMNVLYKCDGMNVCSIKYQNKQKEWHYATKPLNKFPNWGTETKTSNFVCSNYHFMSSGFNVCIKYILNSYSFL